VGAEAISCKIELNCLCYALKLRDWYKDAQWCRARVITGWYMNVLFDYSIRVCQFQQLSPSSMPPKIDKLIASYFPSLSMFSLPMHVKYKELTMIKILLVLSLLFKLAVNVPFLQFLVSNILSY